MTHRISRRAVRRCPLFSCVAASAALVAAGPDAKRTTVYVDRGLVEPSALNVDGDAVIACSNDSDATAQIDAPPTFYRDGTGDLVSRAIGSLEFATARIGERDVDRIDTTLLELVSIASEFTSDDTEVVEIVRSVLRERTVRLRGTFREAPIESLLS